MTRGFALLVVLVGACGGKKDPPEPSPASGSGSAIAMIDAAAGGDAAAKPSGPVELTASYPSSVGVSSHVMNKTIKPEHLVDKDLNTAWNSKTGELVGAWLEVTVAKAKIHEIRLTVGHTGKGPKGEDYFTMNPRIKRVKVSSLGKELATVTLDPEKRELQTIKIDPPADVQVKIVVDEVVMGTKKTWKEVCVSELEAWGISEADVAPAPHKPAVYVYTPPEPPPEIFPHGKPADPMSLCAEMEKPAQEAYDERNKHVNMNEQYASEDAPPSCTLDNETKLDAPWKQVARWRFMTNSAHGPGTCSMIVTLADDSSFWIGDGASCGPWDDENLAIDEAHLEDIVPGGDPELVVRVLEARADVPVGLVICRVANEKVQCTQTFQIETATYKVKPRFSKGTVIFDPIEGKPDPAVSGPQPLVFGR